MGRDDEEEDKEEDWKFSGKGRCMLQRSNSNEDYGFDVSGESPPSDKPQKTKIFRDNGMLYLILHDLSREFIRDLLEVEQIPLNEHQQKLIEDKIKGFYRRIIDHPALTNDRVIFAPKHPDFQHLIPDDSRELSYPSDRLGKRSGPMQKETCSSTSSWVHLNRGETIDYKTLQLYGNQHFRVTECTDHRSPCKHISSGYHSLCVQKTTWVMAYLVDSDVPSGLRWDWISVPSCCACAVSEIAL
ncbi:uncharacterized protein [Apostichopus japonicus]|uniref:uncharacterized protein isoform X2 n=1 Tax=Stichopus japonicus TaxID=307972 RepID=UPI003AB3A818